MTLIGNYDLQTKFGKFVLYGFKHKNPAENIIALKRHDRHKSRKPWIVRIQYGCLIGTAFHSIDCDCARQLDYSMEQIAKNGRGLILYFPKREAYGAGLAAKIRANARQMKSGSDVSTIITGLAHKTVESTKLKVVLKILSTLKINGPIDLLTNSPRKVVALEKAGVKIRSVIHFQVKETDLSASGKRELKAKRELFYHSKL